MGRGNDEYETLNGEILLRTAKAIKFQSDYGEGEPYWLPLSQIIIEMEEGSKTRAAVQVKRWLVEKNGYE